MTVAGAFLYCLLAAADPGAAAIDDPAIARRSVAVTAAASADGLVLAVQIDSLPASVDRGDTLLQQIRAELAAAAVPVVVTGQAATLVPNTQLTVVALGPDRRAVTLEIKYLRSGIIVHRMVDVSSIPGDSVPLAIAIAVDELLRATWSLGGVATGPASTPPPAPRAAPHTPRIEARLLMSGERQRGGTVAIGPDAVVAALLGSRLSVDVALGWRDAGSHAAPDGAISSHLVTAGVGASVAWPARAAAQRAGAELTARLQGAWVSVQGSPSAGASARASTLFGAAVLGGVAGWLALLQPLRLVAFVGWQIPLRTVTAADGADFSVATYAPGFSAAAGLGARF
ncbi:MAG TPA: hypothetical protein VH374_01990 [Polyangia bacterium]|jgi:hypothetical protein|nr:hypothetical protein [Polyangia bacterium]